MSNLQQAYRNRAAERTAKGIPEAKYRESTWKVQGEGSCDDVNYCVPGASLGHRVTDFSKECGLAHANRKRNQGVDYRRPRGHRVQRFGLDGSFSIGKPRI